MDGAEGSQTYRYMHEIDHDRGSWVSAIEACTENRGGSRIEVRRACVCVAMDGIDYM